MLPRVNYLSWAIETFPRAKWDLATSGLPTISSADLGLPASLSDLSSLRSFASKVAARYGVPLEEVVPALGTSGAVWTAAAALLPRASELAAPRISSSFGSDGAASSGLPVASHSFEVVIEEPTYEPLRAEERALVAPLRRRARDPGALGRRAARASVLRAAHLRERCVGRCTLARAGALLAVLFHAAAIEEDAGAGAGAEELGLVRDDDHERPGRPRSFWPECPPWSVKPESTRVSPRSGFSFGQLRGGGFNAVVNICLLYTSDAADERAI